MTMYEKLLALDRELFLAINFDGGAFMDSLMVGATSKSFLAVILVASLVYLYKKVPNIQILYTALALGLVILLADQTCNFFKDNMSRLRPMYEPLLEGMVYLVDGKRGGQYGTVSAHAANSVGTLLFMSLLVRHRLFWALSVVASVAIMYSRAYLGYHYPLDLIYGTITGIIYANIAYCCYKKLVVRAVKGGKTVV